MKYFIPDDRWEFFGINSKEGYLKQNVIEGKFHNDVPEDIVKSFVTVTQLTAQAYYFYPIYDEALNKALRIFELAVKIKAIELGLGKGNFYEMINKICNRTNFEHLRDVFHRARTIRNIQMHPRNHSAGWFMAKGKGNIQMFGNCINEMFLRDEELENRRSERSKINFLQQAILKGPISIVVGDNEFFVEEVSSFRVFSKSGELKIALCLIPYYEDIVNRINNLDCTPYFVILDQFFTDGNQIRGKTVDGMVVILRTTFKEFALKQQKEWSIKVESVPEERQKLYFSSVIDSFIWQCEDLIYNYSLNG